MSEALKPGDVVQLASGGPEMTIQWELNSGGWQCTWFDGRTAKSETFALAALHRVEH